ncbi:hypothetical protein [Haloarcula marina]|uniref:hypothetical protein n=1 Tax=Haloarcula marina TaxID=2961574 RepID=UPI0020B8E1B6|nr:hypothetical protein [Halomicroarcula marina]
MGRGDAGPTAFHDARGGIVVANRPVNRPLSTVLTTILRVTTTPNSSASGTLQRTTD